MNTSYGVLCTDSESHISGAMVRPLGFISLF